MNTTTWRNETTIAADPAPPMIVITRALPDGVSSEPAQFEDLAGRNRVTTKSVGDSLEARDAVLASGREGGLIEGYEQLDEVLTAQS